VLLKNSDKTKQFNVYSTTVDKTLDALIQNQTVKTDRKLPKRKRNWND